MNLEITRGEPEQVSLEESYAPVDLLSGLLLDDQQVLRPVAHQGLRREAWSRPRAISTLDNVAADASDARVAMASECSDRVLVARLAAADPAALSEVFERYSGLVLSVCRRVLRDEALAEDVAQDVFVSLWRFPHRYDPSRGTLRSWLGMLAHHRSVDRVRQEKRRALHELRSESSPESLDDVESQVSTTWLSERVRDALDRLPPDQRKVVVLAYYGDRSYRQVAKDLDIPEGTVKSRVRLALRSLDGLLRRQISDTEAGTPDRIATSRSDTSLTGSSRTNAGLDSAITYQEDEAWNRTPTA